MAEKKQTELTEQQKKFVVEYYRTMDRAGAYVFAGYDAKNRIDGSKKAWTLLQNPLVQEELKKMAAVTATRCNVTVDWVLKKIEETVTKCLTPAPVYDGGGNLLRHTFSPAGACKALELAGRYLAMWSDKQEISVNKTVTHHHEAPNKADNLPLPLAKLLLEELRKRKQVEATVIDQKPEIGLKELPR